MVTRFLVILQDDGGVSCAEQSNSGCRIRPESAAALGQNHWPHTTGIRNRQIARELGLNEDDAQSMTQHLRRGVVDRVTAK